MTYRFLRFIANCMFRCLFHLQVRGRENVYKVKGAILAVNHASFADPVFAGVASGRILYYLARKSLFEYRFLGSLLQKINVMPLDREFLGIGTFKKIIKLLRKGRIVLIFPEGTRSPDGKLLPGRSGIGLVALKAKVPIVPVYIKGAYKVLPRHRNFIRLAKVTVTIGEPIYLDTWFHKSRIQKTDYEEVAKLVMARIRQLKSSHFKFSI